MAIRPVLLLVCIDAFPLFFSVSHRSCLANALPVAEKGTGGAAAALLWCSCAGRIGSCCLLRSDSSPTAASRDARREPFGFHIRCMHVHVACMYDRKAPEAASERWQ